MIVLYVSLALFAAFTVVFALSACRISGECSRNEEAAEAKSKLCPVCNGICGIETAPNDWHDCDNCEATGKVLT